MSEWVSQYCQSIKSYWQPCWGEWFKLKACKLVVIFFNMWVRNRQSNVWHSWHLSLICNTLFLLFCLVQSGAPVSKWAIMDVLHSSHKFHFVTMHQVEGSLDKLLQNSFVYRHSEQEYCLVWPWPQLLSTVIISSSTKHWISLIPT